MAHGEDETAGTAKCIELNGKPKCVPFLDDGFRGGSTHPTDFRMQSAKSIAHRVCEDQSAEPKEHSLQRTLKGQSPQIMRGIVHYGSQF